jgi:hypothetical protein
VSAAEVPPQVSAAWSDDAAAAAIFELSKLLSGESIAEAQGRDPSDPQRARSSEIAGLIVKVLAPLRALSEEQNWRLASFAVHSPRAFASPENGCFVAGTVDGLDVAARTISGELDVLEQGREPRDMTVKQSERIARSLRSGVRSEIRGLEERIEALEEGASASGTYVQHRAAAGRTDTFCGIEIGLGGAGMTGIHVGANGLPIRWTTDALRVTCPECEGAQLDLEGPALAVEPDAGPIALAVTSAGLAEASPVRAASWQTPSLDVSAAMEAARDAVEERNWRPARPALAGDRELFRLGEAIGFPVAFAPAEPLPVVEIEHAEAARRTCGSDPQSMGKMLVCALEGVVERAPRAAHLEALARHLESAAQVVRSWGQE